MRLNLGDIHIFRPPTEQVAPTRRQLVAITLAAMATGLLCGSSMGGGGTTLIQAARRPILVQMDPGSPERLVVMSRAERSALANSLVASMNAAAADRSGRVVAAKLRVPLTFDGLTREQQNNVQASLASSGRGGAPADVYELAMADVLARTLAAFDADGYGVDESVYGLPIEPGRSGRRSVRQTNDRYSDVLARLDVFVASRSFVLSGSSATEWSTVRDGLPEAVRLREDRDLLFRTNQSWRVARASFASSTGASPTGGGSITPRGKSDVNAGRIYAQDELPTRNPRGGGHEGDPPEGGWTPPRGERWVMEGCGGWQIGGANLRGLRGHPEGPAGLTAPTPNQYLLNLRRGTDRALQHGADGVMFHQVAGWGESGMQGQMPTPATMGIYWNVLTVELARLQRDHPELKVGVYLAGMLPAHRDVNALEPQPVEPYDHDDLLDRQAMISVLDPLIELGVDAFGFDNSSTVAHRPGILELIEDLRERGVEGWVEAFGQTPWPRNFSAVAMHRYIAARDPDQQWTVPEGSAMSIILSGHIQQGVVEPTAEDVESYVSRGFDVWSMRRDDDDLVFGEPDE